MALSRLLDHKEQEELNGAFGIAAIVYAKLTTPKIALMHIEMALSEGAVLEMRSEMEFSNLHLLPKFQALLQTNPRRR